MLGESLRDCKDEAARPQSGGARKSGESLVEPSEAGGRDPAVASGYGVERRIEIGAQVEPASDAAKLDDLGTHRQRRQQ
jgi:hypothetical protein